MRNRTVKRNVLQNWMFINEIIFLPESKSHKTSIWLWLFDFKAVSQVILQLKSVAIYLTLLVTYETTYSEDYMNDESDPDDLHPHQSQPGGGDCVWLRKVGREVDEAHSSSSLNRRHNYNTSPLLPRPWQCPFTLVMQLSDLFMCVPTQAFVIFDVSQLALSTAVILMTRKDGGVCACFFFHAQNKLYTCTHVRRDTSNTYKLRCQSVGSNCTGWWVFLSPTVCLSIYISLKHHLIHPSLTFLLPVVYSVTLPLSANMQ